MGTKSRKEIWPVAPRVDGAIKRSIASHIATAGEDISRFHKSSDKTDTAIALPLSIPGITAYEHRAAADNADVDVLTVEHHSGHGAPNPGSHTELNGDGSLTFHGTELLCAIQVPPTIGGSTSTIPQGGCMAMLPVNPRLIDGSRAAALLSMYDQFSIRSMTFHYTQGTNLTQSGQLLMAYVNDPEDRIFLETGFTAVRDAYSRTGSAIFSVRDNSHATIAHPLLKWYYTGSNAAQQFELPGYIAVFNMIDFSNATASSVPLGTLSMTYEISVRSPSIATNSIPSYMVASGSLNLSIAIAADTPITTTMASSGLPTSLEDANVVYWASIVSADDVASGGSSWRSWRAGADNNAFTLSPGNLLFWRLTAFGKIYFFPTFASAADAVFNNNGTPVGNIWSTTTAWTAVTRGFKLYNIMGAQINLE